MPNYKVVDADVLDADLQTVADAIKAKAGTEEALEFPSGFASAVESIETGGGADHTMEDGLITGTLTEYTNDRVESVSPYAFYTNTTITKVVFSAAKSVGVGAFRNCSRLKIADFPNATTVNMYGFSDCVAMETANFPKVEDISQECFSGARKLTTVSLPSVVELGQQAFYRCVALTTADIGTKVNRMRTSVFSGCTVFDTLILRSLSVLALLNINVFANTPFASGGTGGTVYVPDALIEQYQTATNWSTLYAAGTCNFVAIEGSEYE